MPVPSAVSLSYVSVAVMSTRPGATFACTAARLSGADAVLLPAALLCAPGPDPPPQPPHRAVDQPALAALAPAAPRAFAGVPVPAVTEAVAPRRGRQRRFPVPALGSPALVSPILVSPILASPILASTARAGRVARRHRGLVGEPDLVISWGSGARTGRFRGRIPVPLRPRIHPALRPPAAVALAGVHHPRPPTDPGTAPVGSAAQGGGRNPINAAILNGAKPQ